MTMRIRVQLIIERAEDGASDTADTRMYDVASLERAAGEMASPESLGLTLDEAKAILSGMQQAVVVAQAADHVEARRRCAQCGAVLRLKGHHLTRFRSLFGTVSLSSPRLFRCRCQTAACAALEETGTSTATTFSPLAELLAEHVAPERLYLEAK